MGLFDRFQNFINDDSHDFEEENWSATQGTSSSDEEEASRYHQNVVSMNTRGTQRKAAKIYVVEPKIFADAEHIADSLLKGEAVILNFKRMDHQNAIRIIDFLAGVAYAIGGDIQKIREEIFVCSPASFIVDGDLEEAMQQDFDQY